MEEKSFCPHSPLFMETSWASRLQEEFKKPYMQNLEKFLSQEFLEGRTVYPPQSKIFNAFCLTGFDQVKVVIIGQDPYHGPGQAEGLCFSVPEGIPPPPSLKNIFKELASDCSIPTPLHGSLKSWARQGVLLLNATLTVRDGDPKSHHGKGWEEFTDRAVQLLAERKDPLVFLLWGKSALEKWKHVKSSGANHLVLTAPHPSPLSAYAGFFGCHHFSKTNEFLKSLGKTPIDWRL